MGYYYTISTGIGRTNVKFLVISNSDHMTRLIKFTHFPYLFILDLYLDLKLLNLKYLKKKCFKNRIDNAFISRQQKYYILSLSKRTSKNHTLKCYFLFIGITCVAAKLTNALTFINSLILLSIIVSRFDNFSIFFIYRYHDFIQTFTSYANLFYISNNRPIRGHKTFDIFKW